uniref:Epithelial membrane protein 1 n=1 Tax=Schistosoma mansoni TaxID=6183 RepID=A0A5K4F7V0_SCHMA
MVFSSSVKIILTHLFCLNIILCIISLAKNNRVTAQHKSIAEKVYISSSLFGLLLLFAALILFILSILTPYKKKSILLVSVTICTVLSAFCFLISFVIHYSQWNSDFKKYSISAMNPAAWYFALFWLCIVALALCIIITCENQLSG